MSANAPNLCVINAFIHSATHCSIRLRRIYLCVAMGCWSTSALAEERPPENTQTVLSQVGAVDFHECTLSADKKERKVECGWVTVPEDPEEATGKNIDLFVVRLPAHKEHKALADAMLFIAGGPGQGASTAFLFADQIWSDLAVDRDLYLIDQRGTGFSQKFDCPQLKKTSAQTGKVIDTAQIQQLSQDCLEDFDSDPTLYTTANTLRDFEFVREALQIPKWNLLGVSYGTRVATRYMNAYPDSLRTVVLDSVVPPQKVLGPEIAIHSQSSLNTLLQRCESAPPCNTHLPNLAEGVTALFQRLEQSPITTQVENLSTGKIETQTFSYAHLTTLVRMYLYQSRLSALLPAMLHGAATDQNYSPLVRAAGDIQSHLSSAIAMGLHNSVICTEDYPYFEQTPEFSDLRAMHAANTNTYMGTSILDVFEAICSVWPVGKPPTGGLEPLTSSIPTLIVSGEFDPITPPEYGELALTGLTNARHLVVKGQGHFVSGTGCLPNIVARFVRTASPDDINARCAERIVTPPLFINFNGATP